MAHHTGKSFSRSDVIGRLRDILGRVVASSGSSIECVDAVDEDDIIPDVGVVDSSGLIEFVVAVDMAFKLDLQPEDMTIDNLGSLSSIASFVASRKSS